MTYTPAFGRVLEIQGLDVRFGGVDLRPFKAQVLREVTAVGARFNTVDYSVLSYSSLEAAGGGSADAGYDTLAVFEGCESIGDLAGFSDGNSALIVGVANLTPNRSNPDA